MLRKELSIIGLGKLGLCLGVCFASKKFNIIGIDNNPKAISALKSGSSHIEEPGLMPLLKKYHPYFTFTSDIAQAIQKTDITFLVLPTPSLKSGDFDLACLKTALISLASTLRLSRKKYHTFVIVSTVSPGAINDHLVPLIEKHSRRKLKKGFGVCYNPAFIALGSVIHDFMQPDLDLIGESDRQTGDIVANVKKELFSPHPFCARMSIASAEITKISLNSYVTMKISFINSLADICQKIPQANIDDISRALGHDKRISPFYLKAGLGFGGPCFPRDNKAFAAFAKKNKVFPALAKATDQINKDHTTRIIKAIFDNFPANRKPISIVGLSYKPNTPVIEESFAINIIKQCLTRKLNVTVYDPQAIANTNAIFKGRISYAPSLEHCLKASSFWVITNNAPEYYNIGRLTIKNPTTIIDCWGSISSPTSPKIKYIVPSNPNRNIP